MSAYHFRNVKYRLGVEQVDKTNQTISIYVQQEFQIATIHRSTGMVIRIRIPRIPVSLQPAAQCNKKPHVPA